MFLSVIVRFNSTEENYDKAVILYQFQIKNDEWVAIPLVEV